MCIYDNHHRLWIHSVYINSIGNASGMWDGFILKGGLGVGG